MQAALTKILSSQGSEQRSPKAFLQLKNQGKSQSFDRELSKASQRDPVQLPKKINEDWQRDTKKIDDFVKQTSLRVKNKNQEAETAGKHSETEEAANDAQLVSFLQLLGIDPQQVDPDLLEKLTSLLTGTDQTDEPGISAKLLNLLSQFNGGNSDILSNLNSEELQGLTRLLKRIMSELDGFAETVKTQSAVSVHLLGTDLQAEGTDHPLNRLKQLLTSFMEKLQNSQGEGPKDTGPVSQAFNEILQRNESAYFGQKSMLNAGNQKDSISQTADAKEEVWIEAEAKQTQPINQSRQADHALAGETGQNTAGNHASQSENGNPFRLDNMHQVNAGQDTASGSAGNQEPAQVSQELSKLPRMTQAVFSQIVQKAKIIHLPELAEMKIQLKPDFLGKLHLNVSVENGVVTAKFNAESYQVKAIIEANLNTLRDALSEQGVKVDQLIVNVETGADYSGYQGQFGGRHQNFGGRTGNGAAYHDEYDEGRASQILTEAISDVYGSKVNFTA